MYENIRVPRGGYILGNSADPDEMPQNAAFPKKQCRILQYTPADLSNGDYSAKSVSCC